MEADIRPSRHPVIPCHHGFGAILIKFNRAVKEILKIRQDTPTILCTAFSEKIDEEKAKEIGIRQYIEKPVNRSDLAKMIRKVMQ